MPEVRHATVDGARVSITFGRGFGRVGPIESAAYFAVGRASAKLINASHAGFVRFLRSRAGLMPEMRELESRTVATRNGTIESALVERRTPGLVDPAEVSRFTVTALQGRHGCLHTSGGVRERDDDIALFAESDVHDEADGVALGHPVDTTLRPPTCTFHIARGGLTFLQPLTPNSVAVVRGLEGGRRTTAGFTAYHDDRDRRGRRRAVLLVGRDTMAEVVRSDDGEDVERLAEGLDMAWTKA